MPASADQAWMMTVLRHRCALLTLLLCAACAAGAARAVELRGLVDLRAVASDSDNSWTRAGLGKLRYDDASDGLRLGQAVLRADVDLADTVSASLVLSAADDRRGVVDVNEAWLEWSPLPSGPWKARVKAGAFFPAISREIAYDGVGWTPELTISSSAINSWIGEELRTKGVALELLRRGRAQGSAHDIGLSAALFGANDPAGTVIAWRGWSIGDRITGLSETLRLPDLPVYRADGAIPRQTRDIQLFREIDHRIGYYLGANYAYADWLEIDAMHYDNRGDPLVVKDGQYSWHTRFNHAGARIRAGAWDVRFQAMAGSTLMGAQAVQLDYRAWYALASHALGPGALTLRLDRFSASEHDAFPLDPNGETGHALALAYRYPINPALELVAEALTVDSTRAARALLGELPGQRERSITGALRWRF
jgi:hypothetical protein